MFLLPSRGGTIIVLLHILALIAASKTRRWFGPNMCKQLCEFTLGCSKYQFSSCHLTCRIQRQASILPGETSHLHKRQSENVEFATLKKTCAMYSRIFYSRTGTPFCGTGVKSVSGGDQHVIHTVGQHFLAIEYMSSKQGPFYEFHVDTQSVTVYPSLTSRKVKAAGYCGSLRRVILSLADPYGLSYFTIGDNKVIPMKSNILCTALSVDVKRNLLLLAVGLPWSAVYNMAPDGHSYKLLFNISQPSGDNHDYPTTLAMDLSRDCVYICLRNKVLSADLNRSTVSVLFRGRSLQSMDFDPVEGMLYLAESKVVFRISVRTNNTLRIASFQSGVFSLLYHQVHIYVSLFYPNLFVAVNIQNKKQNFHSLSTERRPGPVIICRIE